MIYFLLILLFICIFILQHGYYQLKIYKALNMPISVPYIDDSIALAEEIGSFLSERNDVSGSVLSSTEVCAYMNKHLMKSILLRKEQKVIDFIQMCKILGCEITIKQVE